MQISLLLHVITPLYVIIEKFEFYANCRMRTCESVFIKTLKPSWSYISMGPTTFWFVKKNSVYNVHSCCTFRLAILYLKDRSLEYFAHKFGLGLSTKRVTSLGTALTYMISSVYNFLVLNFCTQGFLSGLLLCLKIGSWKEMNRVIFLWILLFFCPSFSA